MSSAPVPTSAAAIANKFVSGSPVNGSRPFVGGRVADGGGLTKVMPSTVGDTEGVVVGVPMAVVLTETLAVTVDVTVDVAVAVALTDMLVDAVDVLEVALAVGLTDAVAVGDAVDDGLGVHMLLLGLTVVNT